MPRYLHKIELLDKLASVPRKVMGKNASLSSVLGLTRTKQRASLPSSKIINAKVAFLIAKELVAYFNIEAFSVAYSF